MTGRTTIGLRAGRASCQLLSLRGLPFAIAAALTVAAPLRAAQVVADGTAIRVPSGDYTTQEPVDDAGTAGYAFYAVNDGVLETDGPVNLATSGDGAAGAHAQGALSLIVIAGGSISTSGRSAAGFSASDEGYLVGSGDEGGNRLDVLTTGAASYGAVAIQNSIISLHEVDVTTFGAAAHGLVSRDHGLVTLDRGALQLKGDGSHGVVADAGTALLRSIDIRIASGDGLVATKGGRIEGTQLRLSVDGPAQYGARLENTGELLLNSSRVDVVGDRGVGIGVGGDAVLKGTDVAVYGSEAWAAVLSEAGSLSMEGGSLASERHGAILARSGGRLNFTDGARVTGGNGTLLAIDASAVGTLQLVLDRASYAEGDIVLSTTGATGKSIDSIDVQLDNAAAWRGATDVVDVVAISGESMWHMTSDSTVQTLRLDKGGITLSSGVGSFNTLTVAGDLDSNAGRIVFNAALAGDRSPSDILHVTGDTRGTADVLVNNLGGAGGYTVEGIQLIRVDGASNAVFSLSGRAVAGQNEYFLFKGGKANPGDGDWYLRSELPTTPDPCDADPSLPGCTPVIPPDPDPCLADPSAPGCVITLPEQCLIDPSLPQCLPPVPVLRPEPGAYLANQSAATQMFGMRMHDRNGGTARGLSERGAWARVSRSQADYGVIGDQLSVNGDTDVLQVGTDVFTWGEGSRGQLGVMLGSGRANNTVTSRLTGYSAKGKVEGQAIGVYGSWLQDPAQTTGLYVDAWAQRAQFKNSVQGDGLSKERYDSTANSASVEAGYGVQVANGERVAMFVEPQLQLSYTRSTADSHTESNGTVINGSDADGLTSRVGVRFFGHANAEVGNRVQPFVSINWIHESSDNSLRFDGERVAGGLPQNRYEAKAGASLQLGDRWTAWGDLGLQRGDDGYKDVSGQIGLRSSW
ncbi:autotransporter outer membrane beta-barrel domain-containing protein [Stenotrophomonas sp. SAM-B]|uniref:autotransporter family protein n=1 Tax=Stenotrophomonas sp. SAM-B TaxID=2729141 RepID=UPI0015A3633E|nr:autotransporter outer membrane beta-barrel domain-containing protein [Stenotrophomonas sp. SAM-B]NWF32592.1 autotransporter outer membrane beta-barrel domain-containing protein [Stenotrophomonas sp. SAM-B]